MLFMKMFQQTYNEMAEKENKSTAESSTKSEVNEQQKNIEAATMDEVTSKIGQIGFPSDQETANSEVNNAAPIIKVETETTNQMVKAEDF